MNKETITFCTNSIKQGVKRYKNLGLLNKQVMRHIRKRAFIAFYPLKNDFDAGSYVDTQQHKVNVKLNRLEYHTVAKIRIRN